MSHAFGRAALAAFLSFSAGSACAMTSVPGAMQCSVAGEAMLPGGSGGADALCTVLRDELGTLVSRVDVSVRSANRISAIAILADGRPLDEVHAARSDAPVGQSTFRSLAQAIRAQAEQARS